MTLQTDTSVFHTYCRRQQSCWDPEGRAEEVSPLWAAVNPPTPPGSAHVITPASNELPSRSCCPLESNQEAHESPTASWSSSFLLLLIFFLKFPAFNYTSNLIKGKLTDTWYFLLLQVHTVDSVFGSVVIWICIYLVLAGIVPGIFPLPGLAAGFSVLGQWRVKSRTNQLSQYQSQEGQMELGTKDDHMFIFFWLRAAEACCLVSGNITLSITA